MSRSAITKHESFTLSGVSSSPTLHMLHATLLFANRVLVQGAPRFIFRSPVLEHETNSFKLMSFLNSRGNTRGRSIQETRSHSLIWIITADYRELIHIIWNSMHRAKTTDECRKGGERKYNEINTGLVTQIEFPFLLTNNCFWQIEPWSHMF